MADRASPDAASCPAGWILGDGPPCRLEGGVQEEEPRLRTRSVAVGQHSSLKSSEKPQQQEIIMA